MPRESVHSSEAGEGEERATPREGSSGGWSEEAKRWRRWAEEQLERRGLKLAPEYARSSDPVTGLPILGRGWSSIVLPALHPHLGLVAVKLYVPWGRRTTALWEAAAWLAAASVGVAPRLHEWTLRMLVVDAVLGPSLGEWRPRGEWEARLLLRRLIWKAYLLDKLGLRHNELARPEEQVLVDERGEPWVIDFDSATVTPPGGRPRNVPQLVAGLHRLPWLPRSVAESLPSAREVVRRYKRLGPSLELLEELLEALHLN